MRKSFMVVIFLGFWLFSLSGNSVTDENTVSAATTGDNGTLSQKLDKVISTQGEILKQLDEIKSELQVVKVRASQG